MLEKHKDLKIVHQVKIKKQQEYKRIGSTRRKKGQFLFAYDPELEKVYKIEVEKISIIDIDKENVGTHKAKINPAHPMIYAINYKNAVRKFKKLLKL